MQEKSEGRLLRGAAAITDYIRERQGGGKPITRAAVYRMIESQKLPITRLGPKGTEIWTTTTRVDEAFGLAEPALTEPAAAAA